MVMPPDEWEQIPRIQHKRHRGATVGANLLANMLGGDKGRSRGGNGRGWACLGLAVIKHQRTQWGDVGRSLGTKVSSKDY